MSVSAFVVEPASAPLEGSVPTPPDSELAQRAMVLAAVSAGRCRIAAKHLAGGVRACARALSALGVEVLHSAGGLSIAGVGLDGLRAPSEPLDLAGAPAAAAGLLGILAAQPFESRLQVEVDAAVAALVERLRERGAAIDWSEGGVRVSPRGNRFEAASYTLAGASGNVKHGLLLSGLYAAGPTVVHEGMISDDHSERLLDALGMPIDMTGSLVELHPPAARDAIRAFELSVPGDVRAANYLLCASQMVPHSRIDVRATSLNPTRHAVLDALRCLGAETGLTPETLSLNEPAGLIVGRHAPLKGSVIGGEVGARLGDDLFPLAAAAARAQGQSVFSDLSAPAVASLPRLAWLLGCFGISCRIDSTDLIVDGAGLRPLKAARVTTDGDHRMAMTAALLGLAADATTEILDVQSVATAFPRFVGTLRALGARIEVKDA